MRTIALPPALTVKLREHRLRCAEERLRSGGRPDDLDLVFRTRTGYPYNHNRVDLLVREARKRAGLGAIVADGKLLGRAPTPHDLRHTHASKLIAAGWDVAEVAARLGDSIQTVILVYAHEWEAARRREEQRDRLAAIYGSAMEAPASGRTRSGGTDAPAKVADLRAFRSETG